MSAEEEVDGLLSHFDSLTSEYDKLKSHPTFLAALRQFLDDVGPVALELLRPAVHGAALAASNEFGPAGALLTTILDAAADAGIDHVENMLRKDAKRTSS
jgi:hypothetical protein